MQRRHFAITGLSAIAAASAQSTLAAAPDHHAAGGHATDAFKKCAEACSRCQRECSSCANHCAMMVKEGKTKHAETLDTCLDCADFCGTASKLVARQGPMAKLICEACAEACAMCEKACKQFPDDKHMAQCAEECRKCEKACREMVAATK